MAIKKIGVIGGGIMGGGIAQTAIVSGYQVVCRDLSEEILQKTRENIVNGRFGLSGAVERGKMTKEEAEQAISRLTLTTKVEDLADVDMVIEAIGGGPGVREDKNLKLKVFSELDNVVKKSAVFASNTSFYTIADMATSTNRRDRFLGMHWYSPANIMKVVEVTWTAESDNEVVDAVIELCKSFGKIPVKVKDVPGDTGFVGNRVMIAAINEAKKIVEQGIATPEDVDTVMTLGFNWPAGPFGAVGGAKTGWSNKK